MQILTFGRQKEKECAGEYLHDPKHLPLIHTLVDGVHDLIEGRLTEDTIRPILSQAFIKGGTGVWEQTGGWLRRLMPDFPSLQSLWVEFAGHAQWKVRFRAACFINEMPQSLAVQVGNRLKLDRSEKVRQMAEARLEELENPNSLNDRSAEQHQKLDNSEAACRWATVTERRCPECNSLCPEYRKTCKVCGFEIGRISQ